MAGNSLSERLSHSCEGDDFAGIHARVMAVTRDVLAANRDASCCNEYPEIGVNPEEVLLTHITESIADMQSALEIGNTSFVAATLNVLRINLGYYEDCGVNTAEARKKLEAFNSQLSQRFSN